MSKRKGKKPDWAEVGHATVARRLGITDKQARCAERRAFRKLRRMPQFRALLRQLVAWEAMQTVVEAPEDDNAP